MLVTQFDKFVNRSTREILGSEIEQENLEPMLSTDLLRNGGIVTGVKGEKEVYYRTGNVNLNSADIGALDEENVYNGLDKTETGYALDARQGKVLDEAIDNKLDKANVYNGLDQINPGYALDARQGKTIVDKVRALSNSFAVVTGVAGAKDSTVVVPFPNGFSALNSSLISIHFVLSNNNAVPFRRYSTGDIFEYIVTNNGISVTNLSAGYAGATIKIVLIRDD